MLAELAVFTVVGIVFGMIAGLLPGLHPNNIALIAGSLMASGFFPSSISFICFMVALGITNVIISFIPAIFLGAPDESSSLSALPGHRLLLMGMGNYAIKLAIIGCIGSVFLCIAFLPITIYAMPLLYESTRPHLWWILSSISLWLIIREKKKIPAMLCFILSGILGVYGSMLPVNQNFYLFPLLSGLFGIPIMLLSLSGAERIPPQTKSNKFISKISSLSAIIKGAVAGLAVGILPGIGASQAAAVAGAAGREENDMFLVILGSVAVSNTLFSFLSLWLIGNPRSGMAVEIGRFAEIGFNEFLLMIAIAATTCGIASIIALRISSSFAKAMEKINYRHMSAAIIILVFLMIFAFTSFYGILIATVAALLGIYANLSGISRSQLMGCLLLPTILFFAGF